MLLLSFGCAGRRAAIVCLSQRPAPSSARPRAVTTAWARSDRRGGEGGQPPLDVAVQAVDVLAQQRGVRAAHLGQSRVTGSGGRVPTLVAAWIAVAEVSDERDQGLLSSASEQ